MQKAFSSRVIVVCALQVLTFLNISQVVAQTSSPPALLPLPAGTVGAEAKSPVPAANSTQTVTAPTDPVEPATVGAGAPLSAASLPVAPLTAPALAVNILVVPMELNEAAAPAGAAPATIDGVAAAGPSQSAAAALRRALVSRGWADVLTAPPDGGVVRRLVTDGKVTAVSLAAAQNALRQLESQKPAVETHTSTQVPAATAPALNTSPATASAPLSAPLIPVAPGAPVPAASTVSIAATVSTDVANITANQPLEVALREAIALGRSLNYRAVVLLGLKRAAASTANASSRATYVLVLADTLRETAQARVFEESGATAIAMHDAAANSGLKFLEEQFATWPNPNSADRDQKIAEYLQSAREQIAAGKVEAARSFVNHALALDSARAEIYIVQGDALLLSNPAEAAEAYRKAIGKNGANEGEIWARVASAHSKAQEWPRTLEAGSRALAAGYDSAALRATMAAAQFGRASLFRNAGQEDNAEAAAAEANKHLERAKTLSPDDPGIARTQAAYMISQNEYLQTIQLLDPVAPKFPDDIELQTIYATALTQRSNRGEDAFEAWSRVWQAKGTASVTFSTTPFRRLAQGYDEFASNTAREAATLTQSVLNGAASREEALPKLQELLAAIIRAQNGIKIMQPPNKAETRRLSYRIFAADLLVQALGLHRTFIETGDRSYLDRANDLHRQAIVQINTARVG